MAKSETLLCILQSKSYTFSKLKQQELTFSFLILKQKLTKSIQINKN